MSSACWTSGGSLRLAIPVEPPSGCISGGGTRCRFECERPAYPEAVLPETDVARIRRWVDVRNERLPERARGQIRYELDVGDRHVTLCESTGIFWG